MYLLDISDWLFTWLPSLPRILQSQWHLAGQPWLFTHVQEKGKCICIWNQIRLWILSDLEYYPVTNFDREEHGRSCGGVRDEGGTEENGTISKEGKRCTKERSRLRTAFIHQDILSSSSFSLRISNVYVVLLLGTQKLSCFKPCHYVATLVAPGCWDAWLQI